MFAVVYDDYGGPEKLHVAELAQPQRSRGELLIEVAAAGVNPVECRMRSGELKGLIPGGFPRIPGYDVAGTVVECDGGEFSPGDRVMAFLDHVRGGGYASLATCGESAAAKIPDSMSFATAAAIPLAGSTALQSLRNHGAMKSTDRVLVNGASGGVGMFAVQVAKADGCVVDAVASGANRDFCLSLGADGFYDYHEVDFTKLDRKWDIVFDAAGKTTFLKARGVLAEGGRYVTTEPNVKGMLMTLLTWPLSKSGKAMLARSRSEDLYELIALHEAGKLHAIVDRTFSMRDAAEAHRRLESGAGHGKIVLVSDGRAAA